jgi:competence protein ComEA
MHAPWIRMTVIAAALTLLPWTARAADKSGDPAPDKPRRHTTTTVSAPVGADAKININTAGVKELMSLSGIGHKVAERIVEYRDAHGPFKKPEDLKKVEGVGPGVLDRNRERVVTK